MSAAKPAGQATDPAIPSTAIPGTSGTRPRMIPLLLTTSRHAALPILLLLLAAVLIQNFAAPYQVRLAYAFFLNLIMTLSLQMFMGNSGVVSFGHVSFMGIGSYAVAILTIPAAMKTALIPTAPFGLAGVQLPVLLAAPLALLLVGLIAWGFGFLIVRLSGAAAEILTLALLVIVYVVLNGWVELTRGARSLYGVPVVSGLMVAALAGCVAIFAAKLFRDSDMGLQLRASSEDHLAARAMGVPIKRLRHRAWVFSALLAGLAGVLHSTYLGTIGPNSFYFNQTFLIMAMLILGGIRTVSGAIVGSLLISIGNEIARTFENGPVIFGQKLPEMFGLTGFFLGAVIVLCMTKRREGLMGDFEFEDLLRRRKRGAGEAAAKAGS